MTKKFFALLASTLIAALIFIFNVPKEFCAWALYVAGVFFGLVFFDSKMERETSEASHVLYLILMATVFFATISKTEDDFWRVSAGALLIMALVIESKSKEWALGGQLRSYAVAMPPLYLIIVASTLEMFTPDGRALLSLFGLVLFSAPLILASLREGREVDASTSAIALATCGTLALFGSQFVVQDIAAAGSSINNGALIGLPILALLVSTFCLFVGEKNKRRNMFYGVVVLLLIWSALSVEKNRFAAAFCLLLFLVWHSGLPIVTKNKSKEVLGLFSEYSRWAMPGSAAFTALIIILLPSEILNLQIAIMLWLVAFILFWLSTGVQNKSELDGGEGQWDWKGYAALSTAFIGGLGLLGLDQFPQFLEHGERIIQQCISSF